MQSRTTPSRPLHAPYVLNMLLLSSILSFSAAVRAAPQDPSASIFSFSGFGTIGLIHSNEGNADFTASIFQPSGAGYTRAWSPDVDSRLGAQVTAQLMPQLSAMLQVITEQNPNNTFTPHVEWANISYQPMPELTLRAGRIVLPTFLLSDTRKVGFANPWVRPPVELYGLSPIFNSDGADASYKMHVGEVTDTLVSTYGKTDFEPPQGGTFNVKHLWVIADTIEYGALTVHMGYQTSSYSYTLLDSLFGAFRQFGPQGTALADQYDFENKRAQFITVGALYDVPRWFVTGEWAKRNLHSASVESTAWYLSGGYRLAKFTPYLIFAEAKADGNTYSPGLNISTLPPYLQGPASGLNAALNAVLLSVPVQNTISVGSRWDMMKNLDLKLQYDHIDLGAGSAGTLVNVQPGFQPGGTVNLWCITIDFVW